MSNFDLTVTPNHVAMFLRDNTGLSESPLVAAQQTVDRGGLKWVCSYAYTALRGDDRAEMMGLLASLRGRANRLRVAVYDNPKRGAYGGTPIVDGAGQTGSSINVRGCSISITNWIRRGDYFSIVVNGEPELKVCTADASSGIGGLIQIFFEPRLRFSPADASAIYVEDGVLSRPKGIFMVDTNELGWSSMPGQPSTRRSAMELAMIEDVFATKP